MCEVGSYGVECSCYFRCSRNGTRPRGLERIRLGVFVGVGDKSVDSFYQMVVHDFGIYRSSSGKWIFSYGLRMLSRVVFLLFYVACSPLNSTEVLEGSRVIMGRCSTYV